MNTIYPPPVSDGVIPGQQVMDYTAHARNTDPESSHQAARAVSGTRVKGSRYDCLLALASPNLRATADEVHMWIHRRLPRRYSQSRIRSALKELCDAGLAVKVDRVPMPGHRFPVARYEATEKGLKEVAPWLVS